MNGQKDVRHILSLTEVAVKGEYFEKIPPMN